MICLLEAPESGAYSKAYLVLGGEGWTLRSFYTSSGLSRYIIGADKVERSSSCERLQSQALFTASAL